MNNKLIISLLLLLNNLQLQANNKQIRYIINRKWISQETFKKNNKQQTQFNKKIIPRELNDELIAQNVELAAQNLARKYTYIELQEINSELKKLAKSKAINLCFPTWLIFKAETKSERYKHKLKEIESYKLTLILLEITQKAVIVKQSLQYK